MTVFVLTHEYEDEDHDDAKLIGVFSTRETAEAALDTFRELLGFRVWPEGFVIDEWELDKPSWSEGFSYPDKAIQLALVLKVFGRDPNLLGAIIEFRSQRPQKLLRMGCFLDSPSYVLQEIIGRQPVFCHSAESYLRNFTRKPGVARHAH